MATIDSLAEDVKDVLDILKSAVLPALTKLDNKASELEESQDRLENKIDIIAEAVTVNNKKTDNRHRVLESKLEYSMINHPNYRFFSFIS